MDKYGRLLAYVCLMDGTFLNAEMIKQGYGHAFTKHLFKYPDRFRQDEKEARAVKRGLLDMLTQIGNKKLFTDMRWRHYETNPTLFLILTLLASLVCILLLLYTQSSAQESTPKNVMKPVYAGAHYNAGNSYFHSGRK